MRNKGYLIGAIASVTCLAIATVLYKFYKNTTNEPHSTSMSDIMTSDKVSIVKYKPVFYKIDDFLNVGIKIVSTETQYKAPYEGCLRFYGNRQKYRAGDVICKVENLEIQHSAEHNKVKENQAVYMLDYAKSSRIKSASALTLHALKEFEFEVYKAREVTKASVAKINHGYIKAPSNCILLYPLPEDGAQVHHGQQLFSIASMTKIAQGQIPIKMKSLHNICTGDRVTIIDSRGNQFKTTIQMINEPTSSTQGSVFFQTKPLSLDDNITISNIGTALIYKNAGLRCIIPAIHTYQGSALVMTGDAIQKRKCFVLNDGRVSVDLGPNEFIVMPTENKLLNRKLVDDILNVDPDRNLIITGTEEYVEDDETKSVFTQEEAMQRILEKQRQDNARQEEQNAEIYADTEDESSEAENAAEDTESSSHEVNGNDRSNGVGKSDDDNESQIDEDDSKAAREVESEESNDHTSSKHSAKNRNNADMSPNIMALLTGKKRNKL